MTVNPNNHPHLKPYTPLQLKRHFSVINSKNPPVTTYDFQPRLASYHRQSDTELLKVRRKEGTFEFELSRPVVEFVLTKPRLFG